MRLFVLALPLFLLAESNTSNSLKNGESASFIISAPIAEFYYSRGLEMEVTQTHPLNQLILDVRKSGKDIEEFVNYNFQKYITDKASLQVPPNLNRIGLDLVIKFRLE